MKLRIPFWVCLGGVITLACATFILHPWRWVHSDPQTSSWQREYWTAKSAFDQAFEGKAWPSALTHLDQLISLSPFDPAFHIDRAMILARLDQVERACDEVGKAVELGWTDLQSLASEPSCTQLRKSPCWPALENRAGEVSAEQIPMFVPPALDRNRLTPLLIVFHGMGQNPHKFIQHFKAPASELGIVVAAPRGLTPISASNNASFHWNAQNDDPERTRAELRKLIDQAMAKAAAVTQIDPEQIYLAGYSQGGAAVLALLPDAPGRFRGAILEATSSSPSLLARFASPWRNPGFRAYFLVHEFDRLRPQGEEAFRQLAKTGIEAHLETVEDCDHELPQDETQRLIRALRFVLTARQQ